MAEKSQKMSRQELRAPDAFQRIGAEARDWIVERQKLVAIAAAVLLLGVVGAVIAGEVADRGEARSAKALGDALKILERPVEGQGTPPQQGTTEPPFKSQREQDEALRSALRKVRTEHEGTQAAATAALPLGKAEHRLGNYDAALEAFEAYLSSTGQDNLLRAQALEGKGYAHEAKGDYERALQAFEQLSQENTGEFLVGMGRYHRARILILQDKKEEAAQLLSELPSAHPNSAAARLASERLAVLAAQGVQVPTAQPGPAADGG